MYSFVFWVKVVKEGFFVWVCLFSGAFSGVLSAEAFTVIVKPMEDV
jgi:hypothetical protein